MDKWIFLRSVCFFSFPSHLLHSLTPDRGSLPLCLDIIVALRLLVEVNARMVSIGYILTTPEFVVSVSIKSGNNSSNIVLLAESILENSLVKLLNLNSWQRKSVNIFIISF